MSTRCNIVIKIGSSKVYLYRHCDGYPAEAGADLLERVREAKGKPGARYLNSGAADRLLRSMLGAYYDKASYEKEPKAIYELTSELHGDIEHVYYIEFKDSFNTGEVSIRYAARPKGWSESDLEVDDWAIGAKRYSLENFRLLVNKERRECNVRIAELRAKEKFYADCEDYPMIEAEKEAA